MDLFYGIFPIQFKNPHTIDGPRETHSGPGPCLGTEYGNQKGTFLPLWQPKTDTPPLVILCHQADSGCLIMGGMGRFKREAHPGPPCRLEQC